MWVKTAKYQNLLKNLTNLVEQHDKLKLSLMGIGTLRIRPEFENAFVSSVKLQKMLPNQKDNFFKKLDSFNPFEYKKSLQIVHGDLVYFELPGLSPELTNNFFFKSTENLKNENSIVHKPNSDNCFLVPSKSSNNFHTVKVYDSGNISCDRTCQSFQGFRVCFHKIAVARKKEPYYKQY